MNYSRAVDPLSLLISGALMLVIGIASIEVWRRTMRIAFGWFAIGAGLWFVAVVVKIAVALLADEAILGFLQASLPRVGYLIAGSTYLGLWSAVCEMGAVLGAASAWRRLATDRDCAVAIGIGAGGFEAALLGVLFIAFALVSLFGGSMDTPASWLLGPVERLIATLCHVSTRLLVLMAFARGRRSLAVFGVLLFALLDGLASLFHIAGWLENGVSAWWVEITLAPLAVASIFIIRWCYARYSRWGGTTLG